jgi:hypothetical protein
MNAKGGYTLSHVDGGKTANLEILHPVSNVKRNIIHALHFLQNNTIFTTQQVQSASKHLLLNPLSIHPPYTNT